MAGLVLSSLHLLLTFSVANIIFPLGFGFDPFIHQATEKHILDFGFILPKKLYYIGQYVLVGFLSKISIAGRDSSPLCCLRASWQPGISGLSFLSAPDSR